MQVFGGLKSCRCLAKPRGRLAESLDILRSLGADTYPSSNILLRVRDTLESNPEFRRELVQYGEFETCPLGARHGLLPAVRTDHSENNVRPRVRSRSRSGGKSSKRVQTGEANQFRYLTSSSFVFLGLPVRARGDTPVQTRTPRESAVILFCEAPSTRVPPREVKAAFPWGSPSAMPKPAQSPECRAMPQSLDSSLKRH